MKKITLLLLPVFLFIAVGFMITACPSEPDPIQKVENPDFELVGGRYWHIFDQPRIEEGKEYIVTLRIDDCDEDFPGSNLGGKLCYKIDFDNDDEDDKVLSGWADSVPVMVLFGPGIYRWTFKAGEKNKDDIDCVVPATTPANGIQFFYFEAQDENWSRYPPHWVFGIKGEITIAERKSLVGTPEMQQIITLDFSDGSHDSTIGKGNIIGSDFDTVMNAGELAFLRFYITNCRVTDETRKEGWAVGAVGNLVNIGSSNPNASIRIPSTAAIGENISFVVDIFVEDFLYAVDSGDSHIFINMFDSSDFGAPRNSKVELWKYPPQP